MDGSLLGPQGRSKGPGRGPKLPTAAAPRCFEALDPGALRRLGRRPAVPAAGAGRLHRPGRGGRLLERAGGAAGDGDQGEEA